MENFKYKTKDNFYLDVLIIKPKNKIKGVVQIAHGMSEHKERYINFMEFLKDNGYACVIHDHRGHGKSLNKNKELGYFGGKKDILVDDLYEINCYIKKNFKNKKIILFGHSMGSLIARRYIQKYDNTIDKLVLCGTPTFNPLSKLAVLFANIIGTFKGNHYVSKFLNKISIENYNKNFNNKNEWLSNNKDNVINYNNDKLCGFIFTVDGFKKLFYLLDVVYKKNKYSFKNKNLYIYIIGGMEDPVINGNKKFIHLCNFFKKVGYTNIDSKLYESKRHEILNESNNIEVYKDILYFINNNKINK